MDRELLAYMKEMRQFWAKKYEKYRGQERHVVGRLDAPLEEYEADTQHIKECFASVMESGKTVIDFGCGIGRFREFLLSYFSKYIGIDVVRKVNKETEFYFLDTFLRKDLHADAIFTSVVLQHITNDDYVQLLLKRFNHCLEVGGLLYMNEQVGDGSILRRHGFSYINRRKRETYVKLCADAGFLLEAEIPRNEHTVFKFKKVLRLS